MFGEKFRELRRNKSLSQRGCGELLGVSASTIGMWETGQRFPDTQKLVEISLLFNVTIDWLLDSELENKVVELKIPQSENTVTIMGRNGDFRTFILDDARLKALEMVVDSLTENNTMHKKK